MYVYKWSQDLMFKNKVSKKERKEKIQNILITSLKRKTTTLPLTQWSKTNSPPKNDYSHIQNYSLFLSRVTKGKVLNRHLIGRSSISIIIKSVIIITIILSIRIRNYWMRWWRSRLRCKTAYSRPPSCNTTNTNVHLIQLRRECIQASIHALQLRHNVS